MFDQQGKWLMFPVEHKLINQINKINLLQFSVKLAVGQFFPFDKARKKIDWRSSRACRRTEIESSGGSPMFQHDYPLRNGDVTTEMRGLLHSHRDNQHAMEHDESHKDTSRGRRSDNDTTHLLYVACQE